VTVPRPESAEEDADLPTSGDRGACVPAADQVSRRPSEAPSRRWEVRGADVVPVHPRTVSASVEVSAIGWAATSGMARRRWDEYGRRIARAGNGTNWWLGDWLRFGIREYGDKYAVASRITGYHEQTLMNYVYVAAHVPIAVRRSDVSWSHHAELTKFTEAEQVHWLERVVDEAMSIADLRRELRARVERTDPATPSSAPAREVCPTCGRPLAPTAHD
jgi:hypothetical protein